MDIRVEELMTPIVVSLRESESVGRADEEMRQGDIRHLPVVDEQERVVGIVSSHDVLRALGRHAGMELRVAEIMTSGVLTLQAETPAYRAAELMMERKIGALPVVDEGRRLIGIVTATDLLGVAHNALRGKVGAELLQV